MAAATRCPPTTSHSARRQGARHRDRPAMGRLRNPPHRRGPRRPLDRWRDLHPHREPGARLAAARHHHLGHPRRHARAGPQRLGRHARRATCRVHPRAATHVLLRPRMDDRVRHRQPSGRVGSPDSAGRTARGRQSMARPGSRAGREHHRAGAVPRLRIRAPMVHRRGLGTQLRRGTSPPLHSSSAS